MLYKGVTNSNPVAIHYLLGAADILAAIALMLYALGFQIPTAIAATGLVLIGKGLVFIGDVFSILDLIIGITMFVLIWVELPLLALCLAIWLGLKGAYTYA